MVLIYLIFELGGLDQLNSPLCGVVLLICTFKSI